MLRAFATVTAGLVLGVARLAGCAPPPPPSTTLIGDSVAYGAKVALGARGAYVDAVIGRQLRDGPGVVQALKSSGKLGQKVVVHLGTTGVATAAQCDATLNALAGRQVTVVTVYAPGWSDWRANSAVLSACAARHGAALRDWASLAAAHDPAWFFSDHRHLRGTAAVQGYTNLVLS